MAVIECKMFSNELFGNVSINVILPTPDSGNVFLGTNSVYPQGDQKYQVLYLLHGISADHSDWVRSSRIENYALMKNLAVVMPGVSNSLYCNLPGGGNYYNYYTQELPKMMQSIFPVSAKREHNFVAGLSMGGFGAMKAALSKPQQYAAAASLSGAVGTQQTSKPEDIKKSPVDTLKWAQGAYGKDFEYYDPNRDNLVKMLENAVEQKVDLPKLYAACGTEDFLYDANTLFVNRCKQLNVDLTYEEGPGVHDWDFWDPYIKRVLDWLPLEKGFVE